MRREPNQELVLRVVDALKELCRGDLAEFKVRPTNDGVVVYKTKRELFQERKGSEYVNRT